MNSHDSWLNQSKLETGMSSVPALAEVTRGMIRREKYRVGCPEAARATVARRLRIGAGSLSNLIRERIKAVSSEVRDRIVSAAIADLHNEISKLEHEKQLLMAMGDRPDSLDFQAVETSIETARKTLSRMRGG